MAWNLQFGFCQARLRLYVAQLLARSGTVVLAEPRTNDKRMPDSVENAPTEAPLVVKPAEDDEAAGGEFQGQQIVGRSNCRAQSHNPHISRHIWRRYGIRQVFARAHTTCGSEKASVLTKSTLRRWRYYGWSFALDKDKGYDRRAWGTETKVARNCRTLSNLNTTYRIFSHHRAITYNGRVATANTGNSSNSKIRC